MGLRPTSCFATVTWQERLEPAMSKDSLHEVFRHVISACYDTSAYQDGL